MISFVLIFLYTLLLHLFFSIFTDLSLAFFAPFLIICCYRTSLPRVLGWAFICGLITDLLSFHSRLGTYPLINCLTISFVYRFQIYFFIDRFGTLPFMTVIFSFIAFWIHLCLFYLTGYPFSLSWIWLKSHLFMMMGQEAFYAGIFFTLPSFWSQPKNKRLSSLISLK